MGIDPHIDHIDLSKFHPLPDGEHGLIGPDGGHWSQLPETPFERNAPVPKMDGEGKSLDDPSVPHEERAAIESEDTQNRVRDDLRNSIEDDKKSSKEGEGKGYMRTLLKLLVAGYLLYTYGSYILNNTQTQAQCQCNYERTPAECIEVPLHAYSSTSCQNCDRLEPKSCCRTCKDVLNQNILFGAVNLSFLGTDDILDIRSGGCKSQTEEECCNSWDSRVGTSTDEVSSCLMGAVEKVLEWVVYGFIVLFILFNIPFIFRLITVVLGAFDKSEDKEHSHSTWWLSLPNLIILTIFGIILYVRGDNNNDLSILGIVVFILILIYFIMNIWNLFHMASSKSIPGSGSNLGKIMLLFVVALYFYIIYAYCFSQDDSSSCTPSDDTDITKQSNLLFELYQYKLLTNNCLDDKTSGLTQYATCLFHPYDTLNSSGAEGFDNSPPNCNMINTDYTSDQGDKKYYCFLSGCSYDGDNCISAPDCNQKASDGSESTSSAIQNYANVAKEMATQIIEFKIGETVIKTGLTKLGEKILQRTLFMVVEKIFSSLMTWVFDPLMMVGFALDLGDPCDYQSFVSNNDIKNLFRDPFDSNSTLIKDRSKPNFFPLDYLQAIQNTQDLNALPFQILNRAYISWTSYVNIGISQVALKGDHIDTTVAKKASDETEDNNYCTFLDNYETDYGAIHNNLEQIYYNDPDVINQINNDEPSHLRGEAGDIPTLKQIQLWKYIYRYCKNGGIYSVKDAIGKYTLVLYNGNPTDGKTNLPNLWDNEIDGMPALSTYIITMDTLLSLASNGLLINGPATLNGVGGKALQRVFKSRFTGTPCQEAQDKTKLCILDDLIVPVSNIYRDYSNCTPQTTQDCDVIYKEFPNGEEFPLYYPSSRFVNTICRYSTRGMKWLSQRYGNYTKSEENIEAIFMGANENVDNKGILGENYYNEKTGLCNYTVNFCHSKACRHRYCYPEKNNKDGADDTCNTPPGSYEKYMDCDFSWLQTPWVSTLGETTPCTVEHLFSGDGLHCQT